MAAKKAKDELKQRLAARILDDVSLTDELDDDEADMLLKWGLRMVENLADKLAGDEDIDDEASPIGAQIKEIRKLMKRLNRLVGQRAYLAQDEVQEKLAQVQEARRSLAALGVETPPAPEESAAPGSDELTDAQLSNREVLGRLLKSITPPEAKQPDESAPKQQA